MQRRARKKTTIPNNLELPRTKRISTTATNFSDTVLSKIL
jgi:hypothetical protein